MMARRKMSLTELADRVGITLANLSILKTKEQWEREGYQVFDTNLERYPAWGKPVSRVNKSTCEQYQFFPITHFYVPQAVCQA